MSRNRVIIEHISPSLNHGRFYVKRVVDEPLKIQASIFADGHDLIAAEVLFKKTTAKNWNITPMQPQENDRWHAVIAAQKPGSYHYKIRAWIDSPMTWLTGTRKKLQAGLNIDSELSEAEFYLAKKPQQLTKKEAQFYAELKEKYNNKNLADLLFDERLEAFFKNHPQRLFPTESTIFPLWVDRTKAIFSTWYEFFPRSSSKNTEHGTFEDCIDILPYVKELGFDTLYFPPVHPIGAINRKGKNNQTTAEAEDVGSPWGIGSKDGGHCALHPQLGDEKQFKKLIKAAEKLELEIALDFALQCAPDHPFVKEHKQWFKWRPDGSVQYAENPPKKYQDILPIYFETDDYKNLWKSLLDIALYWVEEFGIQIFRVDNPHTKPFIFWGWLIEQVHKKHPEVLFLSEAFSRPAIMHQLAKQGFTQSYTYFTWRTEKHEIIEYLNELTQTEQREYFRPNFWPNTPDINPYHLQGANENTYLIRYALASLLSSNTGIYGPVFEQQISAAIPGKEEYVDSEKYEVKSYDWNLRNKITGLITRINHIRKEQPALQQTNNIRFLPIENEKLLVFYKWNDAYTNHIIVVINLDPHYRQEGWTQLPKKQLNLNDDFQLPITDLITGNSYLWNNEWNYVALHPAMPVHIFKCF
ncbi:MAG: alpha-1,4-glucan--maltose-1-phosphate maltosyltransferase [Flavobacteriaceae bacterium]|nr:alpha-1,4-glucan--maltose-1-phosphate maltosyltransferase [Flavobacteriaceae bacterium]